MNREYFSNFLESFWCCFLRDSSSLLAPKSSLSFLEFSTFSSLAFFRAWVRSLSFSWRGFPSSTHRSQRGREGRWSWVTGGHWEETPPERRAQPELPLDHSPSLISPALSLWPGGSTQGGTVPSTPPLPGPGALLGVCSGAESLPRDIPGQGQALSYPGYKSLLLTAPASGEARLGMLMEGRLWLSRGSVLGVSGVPLQWSPMSPRGLSAGPSWRAGPSSAQQAPPSSR